MYIRNVEHVKKRGCWSVIIAILAISQTIEKTAPLAVFIDVPVLTPVCPITGLVITW